LCLDKEALDSEDVRMLQLGRKKFELTPGASKQHRLDCTVVLWQDAGPEVPQVVARFERPSPLIGRSSTGLRWKTAALERATREEKKIETKASMMMMRFSWRTHRGMTIIYVFRQVVPSP
jgi:hypothetical protein